MAGTRECDQCGTAFAPRREHARFCSARCRMAWNAEHADVAAAPPVALGWSVTAMTDVAQRLTRAPAWELPPAAAAVSEATWWVTIVDATLVRYHPGTYDDVLAGRPPGYRQVTEETLAGLRHVRNQMGRHLDPADFIRPAGRRTSDGRAAAWVWNPLPEPAQESLSPHQVQWEMTRYRAYQARLADRDVTETFALTTLFLRQTAMQAAAGAPGSAHAAR
jgi:hypothetical protein